MKHLRANLWLLVMSIIICSVLYPAVLLGIGQAFFPQQAQGNLVSNHGRPTLSEKDAVGSLLIAQPFTGDEYFQPRPSAASYNAAASGASNWGASNYLLRERVARQLGPIVTYANGPKQGQPVGPDIEAWFRSKPDLVARWADMHSTSAQNWVKADKLNADYVANWQRQHPEEVQAWIKDNPSTPEPNPEDLAVPFFKSFAKAFPATWPVAVHYQTPAGKTEKRIEPVKEGADLHGVFFDMWLQEHADVALEPVPADMVMSSGSGLDPHITLANARYQLKRVAEAWGKKIKRDPAVVREEIEKILAEKQEAPLGGLSGVPLVNVLEVNLAMRARLEYSAK